MFFLLWRFTISSLYSFVWQRHHWILFAEINCHERLYTTFRADERSAYALWSLFYCNRELILSQNPRDPVIYVLIYILCRKCEKLQWSFKHHNGDWIWDLFLHIQKNMLTSHIVSDYKSVYFFQQYHDVWNHTFIAKNCFCTFTSEIQTPFHIAL